MRNAKMSFAAIGVLLFLAALPAWAVVTVPNGDCELSLGWVAPDRTLHTKLLSWEFTDDGGGATVNWKTGGRAGGRSGAAGGFEHSDVNRIGHYTNTVTGCSQTPYSVSAWLKATGNSGGYLQLMAGPKGGAMTQSTQSNSTTWAQRTVQAMPSASGEIEIQVWCCTGSVGSTPSYFDDVTIEEVVVPEPAGLIAMLSGLAGLTGLAVRRRAR